VEKKKISNKVRLDRTHDLMCKGLTDREISDRMKEGGYEYVSERTINKMLNQVPEDARVHSESAGSC
jgi:hypothetical protein